MSGRPALRDAELLDVHGKPGLATYVSDVWARRDYIWYVSVNELRTRQVTNVLGNLWHLLNPLLSIAVYYLIFGLLIEVTRGTDNFLLFLSVGLFMFQFTQKSTTDGARAIIGNSGLLKAIKFPRAILPIASTLTELLASASTFAMLFVILLIGGEAPRWSWLLFPAVIALQVVFNLGCAFIAARLTTHFRDMTQILPFVFRLLLYASGVIYSVDAYADGNTTLEVLFTLNPVYCFLTIGRWSALGGGLEPTIVVSATVWSALLLCGGFLWFRAAEERYARD